MNPLIRAGGGLLLLVAALVLPGCSSGSKKLRPRPAPPLVQPRAQGTNAPPSETLRNEISGEIASVHPAGQFVVLRFPVGVMPPQGTVLAVWRQGVKFAEVRVSGPQRDLLIAADILKGECRVGDEVRSH